MNIATKKEQLYAELKVGILEGKYCGKFPPEPVFARQLKVSRNTLRSVYKLLENDGLLVRHPGNGTSLTPGGRRMPQKILFTYMVPNKHFTVDFIIPSILQGVEKALPPEWGLESCPISQLRELPLEKAVQILKPAQCPYRDYHNVKLFIELLIDIIDICGFKCARKA